MHQIMDWLTDHALVPRKQHVSHKCTIVKNIDRNLSFYEK